MTSNLSRSHVGSEMFFRATFLFIALVSAARAQELATKDQVAAALSVRTFEDLERLSTVIASKPFEPSPPLPEAWSALSYDEYRKVVFNPNKAIWRSEKAPFFLEAFHRGFVHQDLVTLASIDGERVDRIPFSTSLFDYRGKLDGRSLSPDFGFAGFRIVGKFPMQDDWQEMLTFLGASYFRARSGSGVYGASGRGLAIDVGLNKPEEFPVFRSYWCEKPRSDASRVRALALMDSPSVVGAYEFVMTPGINRTVIDVRAAITLRASVERIGIAPLTSMWMWGDALAGPSEDERNEVHDSDALVIRSRDEINGESDRWTCRSLMRQNYPSIVQYPTKKVLGFGLLQRDTEFAHFNDKEAKYHLRPSLWVEPTSEWGEGKIQLLELPAEHEGIDNMAVWWSPQRMPVPQQSLPISYRVTFASDDPTQNPLYQVVAHRVRRPTKNEKLFVIGLDFANKGPSEIAATKESSNDGNVTVECSGVRCEVARSEPFKNRSGQWTVTLDVLPASETDPFELRVQLMQNGQPISETWSYLCPIQPPPVALPPWRQKS